MAETIEFHGYRFKHRVDFPTTDWFLICGRCGGQGGIPHYGHVFQGVCFACGGAGVTGKAHPTAEAAEKHAKRLHDAKMKRYAKAEAERLARIELARERMEREAAEEAERQAKIAAERARFEFVGEVGAKVHVEGRVTFIKYIEGEWNRASTRLVFIKQDEEHEVKFFTGAAFVWDMEVGQDWAIDATVKDHDEWNGKKTTLLVRPKGQRAENLIAF